jgi:fused signal recognition particle receptor
VKFFSAVADRLKDGLRRTQEALSDGLDRILGLARPVDAALLDELEALLITADLGAPTAGELVQRLREEATRGQLASSDDIRSLLRQHLSQTLEGAAAPLALDHRPAVILILGVNGSGKTTTAGKLAWALRGSGKEVLLAAADTFRAAAIDQLKIWGDRAGVPVISQRSGADPSAVVFDAVKAAMARQVDALIVDTAGRLHTKTNLMEELAKVKRVLGRQCPGAPHESLMVLDAPTGQNGLSQARLFHEGVGLSGLCLTKLDGTAKGGIVVRIYRELGLPIKLVGTGERLDDLQPFDPKAFVSALLPE